MLSVNIFNNRLGEQRQWQSIPNRVLLQKLGLEMCVCVCLSAAK